VSSRRRHTRFKCDWSSDVCSSDLVGSCPKGQGHETTAAQVVADVLNIHPDLVTVRTGFDTERNVHTGFSGTYASQFAVSGLSAEIGRASCRERVESPVGRGLV